jgi:hypothetical protein
MQAPFAAQPAGDLVTIAGSIPQGLTLRFRVNSQSRAGDEVEKVVRLTMRSGKTGQERLLKSGLSVADVGGKLTVQTVTFGSAAAKYGLAAGDEIVSVLVPAHRPNRYWFALPALLLLAGVVLLQRRRQRAGPVTA